MKDSNLRSFRDGFTDRGMPSAHQQLLGSVANFVANSPQVVGADRQLSGTPGAEMTLGMSVLCCATKCTPTSGVTAIQVTRSLTASTSRERAPLLRGPDGLGFAQVGMTNKPPLRDELWGSRVAPRPAFGNG